MKMDVKLVKIADILNADKMIIKRLKQFYYVYIAKRINKELAVKLIIDKELQKYNVDMYYVMEHPKINGEDWFTYYTFDSEKEFNRWKKFSLKILKKAIPYADDYILNREFSMLNLMWGIRENYERNKNNK